jgi:hypothetical protein
MTTKSDQIEAGSSDSRASTQSSTLLMAGASTFPYASPLLMAKPNDRDLLGGNLCPSLAGIGRRHWVASPQGAAGATAALEPPAESPPTPPPGEEIIVPFSAPRDQLGPVGQLRKRGELFVPFRHPDGSGPLISRVRSTLLTASMQAMRERGVEDLYLRALPPELEGNMRGMIAATWVPLSLAMAHYRACDAMNRSSEDVAKIGEAVAIRTQRTFLSTLGKLASGVGVTPWTFFENHHRIWVRIFDGGDQCVYRLGPKDAQTYIIQNPLLEIPYFRHALRAYYQAAVRIFSKAVTVREVTQHVKQTSTALRFSWV